MTVWPHKDGDGFYSYVLYSAFNNLHFFFSKLVIYLLALHWIPSRYMKYQLFYVLTSHFQDYVDHNLHTILVEYFVLHSTVTFVTIRFNCEHNNHWQNRKKYIWYRDRSMDFRSPFWRHAQPDNKWLPTNHPQPPRRNHRCDLFVPPGDLLLRPWLPPDVLFI